MCILWKNVMVLLYVLKEDDGISENAHNLLTYLNKGVELYIRCSQFFLISILKDCLDLKLLLKKSEGFYNNILPQYA